MSESIENKIKQTFEDSINVKQKVIDGGAYKVLLDAGNVIAESISKKGKLLICGNGGSAADAQHLAAEFLIRLTSDVNRDSIPALSLAQDTSTLTACINDYGSDHIFKRVFSALYSDGDVLLAITTSGNSKNIIETLKLANERGIYSLGFLGGDGHLGEGGGGGGGGVFNCSVIGTSSSSSTSISPFVRSIFLSYDLYSTAPQVTPKTRVKPITKYRFLFLFKSASGFFFSCMNKY